MYRNINKKILRVVTMIVIIFIILFVVGMLLLRYQVEGESNMPFRISKISIIESVEGIENKDAKEKWNFNVNENNDIYIYIEKNADYGKTEIIDKIKKVYHKPVVSVEIDIDGFYSIFTDDVKPVKNIVSHLIEQHKLTDIAFVTGSKGHPHAAKRLEGYCEAMVEHDLPIDMSRVFYGDFWYTCGEEIVNQLLNDPRPLPQAIACGSDTMAIGICEALKKRGISVPQDIVVTGYDSVPAGITYYPCITSAVIPSQITGERAVKYIHSQITGTEFHDITDHSSEICIGQSCGCGISLNDRNNAKSGIWRDEDLGNDFISNNNYMLEGLLSESDMTNYIGTLNWFTYVLGDFEGFYLCLCDNWDNLNENEKAENYLKEGYTSRMNLVLEHGPTENDIHINTVHSFNLAEMLPCIYYKRDHPTTYFFTPVHFNDRCFGYSVISYGKAIRSYDGIYRMWIRYVNSSLESLRRQRKLKAMYRHMRENAITDTMTGIYNRNGFNLYADEIFNKANYKENMVPYIIGAVLIGAGPTIVNLIYKYAKEINTSI